MKSSKSLTEAANNFFLESVKSKYSYNFEWLSTKIIQYPQDIIAFQEIVWKVKPDIIVETGIAHGGSLVLSASLLALIDYSEAKEEGLLLDPNNPKRRVVGVDIDIRDHNRKNLDEHPLRNRIVLLEGSSVDEKIVNKVKKETIDKEKVLIVLDSNHTHDHVLKELNMYSKLVSKGSYCIVFDTVIEDLPEQLSEDRPWGPGNSPKTAVEEFLIKNKEFKIDHSTFDKLLISVAPNGFLKKY